ncbi:MAG: ACT domain-containing protein [Desulfurispora sp.]|uniref:ACT domain-containing protein n=1 Tax=Desulfurispora sp. TaxID=3014275 RepID=UPI0040498157
MTGTPRFYIVQEDILPEALIKTVQAKELLRSGEVSTVAQAVERVGLSRSAFYKYKDKVFPLQYWGQGRTVVISLLLEHRSGVLSGVLTKIAAMHGNVVTINQDFPRQGVAAVTVTVETSQMTAGVGQLLSLLGEQPGVRQAVLLGEGEQT